MFLSEETVTVMDALQKSGYEIYLVGGFVRDSIMGKNADDADFATNATPDEMLSVFKDFRTLTTGLKHGTVTVIINHHPFEITTYRTEKGYSDCRHPDEVAFAEKIEDDLSRRDFTVNSIAYNPSVGYVDPFGGKKDIAKRIIRCVGDPETRFTEDALRILRGLRFSSVLSFSIDEETEKAMFKCKSLLNNISKERVFIELSKMLCGRNIKEVLLKYSEILSVVLPEIKDMKGFEQHNFHHIYDVLEHTAVVVENAPALPHLRFSALLHDCGKPDCFSLDKDGIGHFYSHASISAEKAEKALLRLKSDNKTKDKVVKLIKLHDAPIEENEVVIKKKLSKYGEELFFDLIELKRADTKGLAPEFHSREEHFDKLESIARKVLSEKPCFTLKSLSINGNDLAELGFEGAEIGKCLKLLLNEVIENKTENNKEALKNKALLIKNSEASS